MLSAQREDIAIGAHDHGKVATGIGADVREERLQSLADTDRTAARTASAMRGGESLMEIDVHHVEAHIAWATCPQHRVQVRSVVIHQATTVVD